jgi:APA family basic amino acid/polyamine antiporter
MYGSMSDAHALLPSSPAGKAPDSDALAAAWAQVAPVSGAAAASAADLPPAALSSGGELSAAESAHNPLRRTLGALDLTLIGVSGIVGAGIYVLTGAAAAQYAGPAVVISFLISAVGCAFSCLCYSELAALLPVAGSAYTFVSATLGQFPGAMLGWDLSLEYAVGAATVAVGWSGYFVSLLGDAGLVMPASICSAPLRYDGASGAWVATGGVLNVPAMFIVLAAAAVNFVGIQESALFTRVVVVLKVAVLVIFVCAGATYVNVANWSPFVPPATATFGVFGWSGVLRGSSVLFFAFIGADSVSTAAQEARNPQRDVPIGTLASLAICSVLYVAVGLVLTGVVPYAALNVADPIAVAVNAGGPAFYWLRPVVKVGALLGLTSVVTVLVLGQSRIWYAIADDGLLPPLLARIHPRFRTPHVAVALTGASAALIAGLVPIDVLGEMVSIGTLAAFTLVCVGVLVLRRTQPALPRPFRTPCVPAVPVAGAAIALLQMAVLPWGTWVRLAVWLAIGLAVYFFYSRKHAKPYAQRRVALLGFGAAGGDGSFGGGGAAAAAARAAMATGERRVSDAGDDDALVDAAAPPPAVDSEPLAVPAARA